MKKILIASSALVALAFVGEASASEPIKLTVGGYMEQWAGIAEQDKDVSRNNAFQSDTEIHFKGATTLDNGIEVGASIELEGETSSSQVDEQYLYVNGGFGQVKLGQEDGAAADMAIIAPSVGPVGAQDGDIGNWVSLSNANRDANYIYGSSDAKKVTYYTPVLGGFRAGLSYTDSVNSETNDTDASNDSRVSAGVEYRQDFEGVGIALAATGEDDQASDGQWWHVGTNVSFGNFTVGGSYGQADKELGSGVDLDSDNINDYMIGDQSGYDVGVSYAMDAATVSLTYYHETADVTDGVSSGEDELDVLHLGMNYTLGAGVNWRSSAFYFDNDSDAEGKNDGYGFVTGFNLAF